MIRAGLTGNIGSGKSTVTRIFKSLNVPVFIADLEAKKLYHDQQVIDEVRHAFGDQVFSSDSSIDLKKLAGIIFSDTAKLLKINSIIHPRTLNRYKNWVLEHQDSKYTIHESAILFENKLQGI